MNEDQTATHHRSHAPEEEDMDREPDNDRRPAINEHAFLEQQRAQNDQ